MNTERPIEVVSRKRAAAQELQREIGRRLAHVTLPEEGCKCGAHREGPAKFTELELPLCDEELGFVNQWKCKMRDDRGHGVDCALSKFLSKGELLALFREAFTGLEVHIEHPTALCSMEPQRNRFFNQSGRFVEATPGIVAYVRPRLDATNEPWAAAALRVERNPPGRDRGTYISCGINPLHYHKRGYGRVLQHEVSNLVHLTPTFFVRLGPDEILVPVVRLVSLDANGNARFELDVTVEGFTPAV